MPDEEKKEENKKEKKGKEKKSRRWVLYKKCRAPRGAT
jgi:hypothetical protein